MNVQGKVISCLPVETGQGKNGVWTKAPYIIETDGQYPKKIAISIWGSTLPVLKEGQIVDCQIDIESREYNQRWYTEVKCYKVDFVTGSGKPGKQSDPMKEAVESIRPKITPVDEFGSDDNSGNLPF